jgi:lia operon protein LiaF
MRRGIMSRMLTGTLIIGIGVMFLLRQLGYIQFDAGDLLRTYWPVILIYFGLLKLMEGRTFVGNGGGGGLLLLMVGVVFLAKNLDFIELSPGEIVRFAIPVIIIYIGLKLILKTSPKKRETPQEDEWKSYRPYNDDRPVPPAPPLHPDPTGKFDMNSVEQPHGKGKPGYEQPHEGAGGYQEPQHNPESDNKWSDWTKWGEYNKDNKHGKYKHYEKQEKHEHEHVEWWNSGNPNVVNRSGFIGDIHMGHEYWELKPLNISHFIGDTVLDLTKAQIPYGETRINISSFIGDVKVYVPDDCELGILVVSSTFIGDVKVFGRKEGGIMSSSSIQTPRYSEADKKIKLVVSSFIGDTRVTKVG